jgi:hypothetical protein
MRSWETRYLVPLMGMMTWPLQADPDHSYLWRRGSVNTDGFQGNGNIE